MGEHEHGCRCKDVFGMLSEYVDQELTPEMCAEIEKHLCGCPPCIEFLNSLKRSIRLCHDCETAEKPPELSESAKRQLAEAYKKAMAARRSA